jgi:hypothetical protein
MRITALALAAGLALGGCKKDDDKAAPAPAAGDTAAPAAPTEPYAGPLSLDRMKQAKAAVKPYMPWGQAIAALVGTVGQPTRVDGAVHGWYLAEGDQCHQLEVEKTDKDEVGSVSFGAYDKAMASQFAKCGGAAPAGDTAAADGGAAPAGGDGAGTGGGGGGGKGTGGGGGGGKGTGGGGGGGKGTGGTGATGDTGATGGTGGAAKTDPKPDDGGW